MVEWGDKYQREKLHEKWKIKLNFLGCADPWKDAK